MIGVGVVYILIDERIIADYRFVLGDVRFFERIRIVEDRGGIAVVQLVQIRIKRAQQRADLLGVVEQYGFGF